MEIDVGTCETLEDRLLRFDVSRSRCCCSVERIEELRGINATDASAERLVRFLLHVRVARPTACEDGVQQTLLVRGVQGVLLGRGDRQTGDDVACSNIAFTVTVGRIFVKV